MLPIRQVERILEFSNQDHKDIVLELRNLVAEIAPDATEVTHSRGLTYYFAKKGGPVSAGICQIGIYPDHIRLAFNHGAFLPDPQGLLEGTCLAKRFMRINSFTLAPWAAIKNLISISSQFDPRTLSQPQIMPPRI
jgi:hypothetical protein